ncbi:flagellin N-terminal helical domain-containing protein [Endozoicomonadaceae bacterium StTr2]
MPVVNGVSASPIPGQLSPSQVAGNMMVDSARLAVKTALEDAPEPKLSGRPVTDSGSEAMRHINDAAVLAQMAESAMIRTRNLLNRLKHLSKQSASGLLTAEEREELQDEAAQLVAEIDKTVEETRFEGLNVLKGSVSDLSFQTGPDDDSKIQMSVGDLSAAALGGDIAIADLTAQIDESVVEIEVSGPEQQTIKMPFDCSLIGDQVIAEIEFADDVYLGRNSEGRVLMVGDQVEHLTFTPVRESGVLQNLTSENSIAGSVQPLSIVDMNISTPIGAHIATRVLDDALLQVDAERANLAAVQSQLESVIAGQQLGEAWPVVSIGPEQEIPLSWDAARKTRELMLELDSMLEVQAEQIPEHASGLLD